MKLSNSQLTMASITVVVTLSIICIGCSSKPRRVSQVNIDPETVAAEMMTADTDQDGQVSKEEAKAFPGFASAFARFDADKNGQLNIDEIKTRLPKLFTKTAALLPGICAVTLNGKALRGAIVTFEPEAFFGSTIPKASGKVKSNGYASLSITKEDLPPGAPSVSGLVRPGLYRIKVIHPERDIPEKYNSKTELGVEVSPDTTRGGPFRFKLKS